MMTDNTRERIADDEIAVVANGTCWAVLDLRHRYTEDGKAPLPDILYSGLESREAAEMARREAIAWLLDHGAPYGPSEVPVSVFDVAGRLLKFLCARDVADAESLASDLAGDQPWQGTAILRGPDVPF